MLTSAVWSADNCGGDGFVAVLQGVWDDGGVLGREPGVAVMLCQARIESVLPPPARNADLCLIARTQTNVDAVY